MGNQPIARLLPAQEISNTDYMWTNIHASSGIWTHDPSVRAALDGTTTVVGLLDVVLSNFIVFSGSVL
jgi:hypothetical protein